MIMFDMVWNGLNLFGVVKCLLSEIQDYSKTTPNHPKLFQTIYSKPLIQINKEIQ